MVKKSKSVYQLKITLKNLLQTISSLQHEEYQEMLAWVGEEFDPEKFNP